MKLLFICNQNKRRSLTAEHLLDGFNGYRVRSAGTEQRARVRVTEGLLGWADLIFVMEKRHRDRLQDKFREVIANKPLFCLHITDDYDYMDEELIEQLKSSLSSYIEIPNGSQYS